MSIGAGLAAPLQLGLVIFPMFPARDPRAYQTIGYASGLAFIPPLLIAFLGTRERAEFQAPAPLPLKVSLGFIRRNSAFRSTVVLRWRSYHWCCDGHATFNRQRLNRHPPSPPLR